MRPSQELYWYSLPWKSFYYPYVLEQNHCGSQRAFFGAFRGLSNLRNIRFNAYQSNHHSKARQFALQNARGTLTMCHSTSQLRLDFYAVFITHTCFEQNHCGSQRAFWRFEGCWICGTLGSTLINQILIQKLADLDCKMLAELNNVPFEKPTSIGFIYAADGSSQWRNLWSQLL